MNENTIVTVLLRSETRMTYTLPVHKGDRVLVLSPHPDDETLGSGGAIIKLSAQLVDVTVAILTNGNGGGKSKDIGVIRKEEFRKAGTVLGYDSCYDLNYPDGQLAIHRNELSKQISEILYEETPRLILTPYLLDQAIDHQIADIALAQALKSMNLTDIPVGMYEIWTPIVYPNCYLNITEEYVQKYMAMKCYHSQENYFGIIEKANALSTYRAGLSMRKKAEHMECYKILTAREFIDMVEALGMIQR